MYKVLIVDDDIFISEGLKYIINWESYSLSVAATVVDGKAAQDYIENNPVDILLTDIRMPIIDGVELIKWIRSRKLDIKCIILSGYDDYEYMREAVKLNIENYLIKPINEIELIETLLNIVDKLDKTNPIIPTDNKSFLAENILYRWITNHIENDELIERASLLNLSIMQNFYTAVVIDINLRVGQTYNISIAATISVIIENMKKNKIANLQSAFLAGPNGDIIFVFAGAQKLDRSKVGQYLTETINNVVQLSGMDFFITMGYSVQGYTNLHKSYTSAKMLLDYRLLIPQNQLIDINELYSSQNENRLDEMDFLLIKKAVLDNDRVKVIQFIKDIYQKNYAMDQISLDYLIHVSIELILILIKMAGSENVSVLLPEIQSVGLYGKIKQLRSKNELQEWVISHYNLYYDEISGKHSTCHPLAMRLIKYIDENFSRLDISLKIIADSFKVNAAYLGRVFKDEINIGFSEYLNQVRIIKAQELVKNTRQPVNIIAKMVGYSSINHFSSMFKRLSGQHPVEYRMQQEEKN